jgi:hypothetical protein
MWEWTYRWFTTHTPDRGQFAWEVGLLTCEMFWKSALHSLKLGVHIKGSFFYNAFFDGGLTGRKCVLGLATVGPPAKIEELELRISGLGQAAGA